MIPEIGNFALILALCVALVQGIVSIAGAQLGIRSWMELARPSAQAYFVFVAVAFGCLTYSFIVSDFSVKYVASVSNSMLPLQYRIAAVWGGHEGSLLLWALLLGVWTLAVAHYSRNLPLAMVSRVIGVMGLISVGFLLFTLFTSNPFDRLLPAALDGRDLNPLLQDPGLIIHPPLLYIGYVGFSVAFAFAIAALLGGHMDATWARWSRPWTTVAWVFLTLGISLGSWWAYYELGWGGWWFWDPVENASFMPWLVGTALVHSLAVTEKRGGFKNWTVLLAILAFSLSLLGTFLVRSGVLTSVHAFATDPERGIFILGFLVVVIGGSLALYAWRAPKVGMGGRFQLVSRETFLLTNNVLLVVACGAVLLGTLYPLLLDSLGLGKISVGPPYFDSVFLPLMVPLIFLMGVGPMARWKQASIPDIADRLRWAGAVSIVMALILPFVMGRWSALASLGFALTFWVFASSVVNIRERMAATRANSKAGLLRRIIGLPRAYLGMHAAHIGMGVFIMGVTMVNTYEVEKDMRMDIGDTVAMGGYTFRFDGVTQIEGPNYNASRGQILVSKDGKPVTVLFPEKRTYLVQTMPMTEAAIDTGLFRDLYVSLGEPVSNGAWSVRVYYKPFVSWIWGGTAIMALGGLLAVSDRRYRIAARSRRKEAKLKTTAGGAGLATEEK
ncbi:Cytochrome c heme lyase subunit CcmF [hydrothermal vent metagenome]|uniref:Cytochrome c heme lyase subunit CcmF n=1 Tax=hydrothermal vent metagenome TaxID=652676 RepID=A0A3B0ZZ40_9ZZZZ